MSAASVRGRLRSGAGRSRRATAPRRNCSPSTGCPCPNLESSAWQVESPNAVDPFGPSVGVADAAGVVAKAVGLERAVQAGALGEIGSAESDHVAGRKRQPRFGEPVVRPDIVHDIAKRTKLLFPIAGRPCGTVEVPDRVRSDFVPVAVEIVDIIDAPADLLGRTAETDAGVAAPLM